MGNKSSSKKKKGRPQTAESTLPTVKCFVGKEDAILYGIAAISYIYDIDLGVQNLKAKIATDVIIMSLRDDGEVQCLRHLLDIVARAFCVLATGTKEIDDELKARLNKHRLIARRYKSQDKKDFSGRESAMKLSLDYLVKTKIH